MGAPQDGGRGASFSHINIPELTDEEIEYVKGVPKRVFRALAVRVGAIDPRAGNLAEGAHADDLAVDVAKDVIDDLLDRVHTLRMMMGAANEAVGTLARHLAHEPRVA